MIVTTDLNAQVGLVAKSGKTFTTSVANSLVHPGVQVECGVPPLHLGAELVHGNLTPHLRGDAVVVRVLVVREKGIERTTQVSLPRPSQVPHGHRLFLVAIILFLVAMVCLLRSGRRSAFPPEFLGGFFVLAIPALPLVA